MFRLRVILDIRLYTSVMSDSTNSWYDLESMIGTPFSNKKKKKKNPTKVFASDKRRQKKREVNT